MGNGPETRPTNAQVKGSGAPGADVPAFDSVTSRDQGPTTRVSTGSVEVLVARVVGTELAADATLAVTWKGGDGVVIAGCG